MVEISGNSSIAPQIHRPVLLEEQLVTGTSSFHDSMYRELESQGSLNTTAALNEKPISHTPEISISTFERTVFEVHYPHANIKKQEPPLSFGEQLRMYKEDQLLSKPGGDHFYLHKDTGVIAYREDQVSFTERVGKDLRDAGENFINIFKDIGPGAPIKYVGENGSVHEDKKIGFFGTIANFFKDIASGLTFGTYASGVEESLVGVRDTAKHFFKKVFVDAFFKDVIVGVPRSAIHIGENALFCAINLAEAIPDATIGNFKAGRNITTEVFDDAQVFVDFVTDVVPMGEANSRTHAFRLANGIRGLPFFHNLSTPENELQDNEWKYVRNTPFRKTIETVATLIPIRM
ncbi:MAG: hypothetical protein MRJ65_07400 [Candidatus Brocadiaceae bacterium]|nr:hypothetical protein [Candidatus Brocadiaceae bacterium]